MKTKIILAAVCVALATVAAGCSTDARIASKNISEDAEMFRIQRRVVFFNGITDKYLLSIEGLCSIADQNRQLEVTCKTGSGFKKHFLGLSDNVSYFVEHLQASSVSTQHYKIVFKPQVIIPNTELDFK